MRMNFVSMPFTMKRACSSERCFSVGIALIVTNRGLQMQFRLRLP